MIKIFYRSIIILITLLLFILIYLSFIGINTKKFTSYAGDSNGLVGITTSPIVERVNPLRYLNYNS